MRLTTVSRVTAGLLLALAPLALTACGSSGSPQAAAATTTAPAMPSLAGQPTVVLTRFAKYSSTAQAITYNTTRVPVGADVSVVQLQGGGGTLTVLAVHGLPANQQFGAHVHQNACGKSPEDAGSHYQHKVDPKQPSVNPAYANAQNEIWLDFTTDNNGFGHAVSTVAWMFDNRPHKSIVIHAQHTITTPGKAGTAGDRLACINLS